MVDSTTQKFVEQLKQDTLTKAITWTNLALVPEGFFKLSANLPTILYEHAHNIVIKRMSYRASNHQNGFVYLIVRRVQSGADGSVQNEYYLYVQRNELEDCLPVNAERSSLIELATIIRNITADSAAIQEQQTQEFMNAYLAASTSNNIQQQS